MISPTTKKYIGHSQVEVSKDETSAPGVKENHTNSSTRGKKLIYFSFKQIIKTF